MNAEQSRTAKAERERDEYLLKLNEIRTATEVLLNIIDRMNWQASGDYPAVRAVASDVRKALR